MKTNLKLIALSFIVALTLAMPQLTNAADWDGNNPDGGVSPSSPHINNLTLTEDHEVLQQSDVDAKPDSRSATIGESESPLGSMGLDCNDCNDHDCDACRKSTRTGGSTVPANSDAADEKLSQGQITLGGIAADTKEQILIMAAGKGTSPGALRFVCKEWTDIVYTIRNQKNSLSYSNRGPCWQAYMRASWGVQSEEDEEVFESFLAGMLVYTDPNSDTGPDSNTGKVKLRIRDLINPLGGTFDISMCGVANTYFEFTTSLSDFFAIEEGATSKVNILIAPRFLIEQRISTTAQPFAPIMVEWKNPEALVAIFWKLCSSEPTEFDYLVSSSLHEISSRNMLENWLASRHDHTSITYHARTALAMAYVFR